MWTQEVGPGASTSALWPLERSVDREVGAPSELQALLLLAPPTQRLHLSHPPKGQTTSLPHCAQTSPPLLGSGVRAGTLCCLTQVGLQQPRASSITQKLWASGPSAQSHPEGTMLRTDPLPTDSGRLWSQVAKAMTEAARDPDPQDCLSCRSARFLTALSISQCGYNQAGIVWSLSRVANPPKPSKLRCKTQGQAWTAGVKGGR